MKLFQLVALALALHLAPAAANDDYPSKPIRIVVGFAPGGGGDAVSRLMAEHMARTLKQPVTVENRAGAGATLAPAFVATAAPDGYTLVLGLDTTYGADKVLFRPNVQYDEANFVVVSRWATTHFMIGATKSFTASKAPEIAAAARANPSGELFISTTWGTYPAIFLEQFNRAFPTKLVIVPFKGGGPAALATVAGEVPLTISAPGPLMPLFREGRLRPVAVLNSQRSSLAPDIPTMAELGLPDITLGYAFTLAGPAGLPPAVAQKLFDAGNLALNDPAVKARLANLGYEPAAPAKSLLDMQQAVLAAGRETRRTVEALKIKGTE